MTSNGPRMGSSCIRLSCLNEITEATGLWNSHRSALASLLSFSTTNAADAVPQNIGGELFEERHLQRDGLHLRLTAQGPWELDALLALARSV